MTTVETRSMFIYSLVINCFNSTLERKSIIKKVKLQDNPSGKKKEKVT